MSAAASETPSGNGTEGPDQYSPVNVEPESTSPAPVKVYPSRPRAPSRRFPRRSRTGCKCCKDRKIKCDERRPSCLNCIAHGDTCPYLDTTSSDLGVTSRPVSQHGTSTSPEFSQPLSTPLPGLPILELELLHNFVAHTYHTLCIDSGIQELWRVHAIQHGLKRDYIMRAILAVSALHLAHRQPDRRDFYTRHAIEFHQSASRSAMEPLRKVDKEHNASLFLFSVLTVYFALASRHKSEGYPFADDDDEEESNFPDWAFLVSGAKSVVDVIGVDLEDPLISPFMAWATSRMRVRAKCEESRSPWLRALQERIHASVVDEELLRTYDHAIHELDVSFQSTQDQSTPKDVLDAMIWLWITSNSLLPLLKRREQAAVAIFAHFCVLLKIHEGEWFLDGWADHLLIRSHDILDEEHKAWITWSLDDGDIAVAEREAHQ